MQSEILFNRSWIWKYRPEIDKKCYLFAVVDWQWRIHDRRQWRQWCCCCGSTRTTAPSSGKIFLVSQARILIDLNQPQYTPAGDNINHKQQNWATVFRSEIKLIGHLSAIWLKLWVSLIRKVLFPKDLFFLLSSERSVHIYEGVKYTLFG